MQAVILAGGKGTRLRPFTTVLPKPLMPINDMPILEIVIRQLKKNGFDRITMAVGYLASLLEAYFGDGRKWDMKIEYSLEEEPLGTAGPLKLIDDLDDTFLMMNGDILTNLKYADLMSYHKDSGSRATISVYDKPVKIDLGILKYDPEFTIYDYIEKPTLNYQVSMGIYVLNRELLELFPQSGAFDIPDLIKMLIQKKMTVKAFHFDGYWRDIGRHEDYEMALDEYEQLKTELLK